MLKKISKKEAEKKVSKFFLDIGNKTPKEVKKIKKLAMSFNLSLKEKRRGFCEKCFLPYQIPKIRIKNKIKSITCENCGHVNRCKINSS
jgi:RNase P subunit RPR2